MFHEGYAPYPQGVALALTALSSPTTRWSMHRSIGEKASCLPAPIVVRPAGGNLGFALGTHPARTAAVAVLIDDQEDKADDREDDGRYND